MRWLTATLLLLFLWLQYQLWIGPGSRAEVSQLRVKIAEQQRLNRKLSEQNQRLMAEVAALKDGLDAVEERARRELGMIKEGETLFLLNEEKE